MQEKKELKKDVNRVSLGVIIYTLLMYGSMFVYMFVALGYEAAKNAASLDEFSRNMDIVLAGDFFEKQIEVSGVPYFIAIGIGILFLLIYSWRSLDKKRMFQQEQRMTAKSFGMLLCVFMGVQLPFSLVDIVIEKGLNRFGYTAMEGVEMASAESVTLSMFLYASFLGPVAEELIYRGFVMKSLEKHGKILALVVSSILFGVMHGNLTQSMFAIFVGLVLGYVAMEYSLKWSILLHIINNCLFGEIMSKCMKGLSESTQEIISYGIMGAFFVGACVIVWKKRCAIRNYIQTHSVEKRKYLYAFTSVCFLIFVIAAAVEGFLVITPMK